MSASVKFSGGFRWHRRGGGGGGGGQIFLSLTRFLTIIKIRLVLRVQTFTRLSAHVHTDPDGFAMF